jgi:hypothetical protein
MRLYGSCLISLRCSCGGLCFVVCALKLQSSVEIVYLSTAALEPVGLQAVSDVL